MLPSDFACCESKCRLALLHVYTEALCVIFRCCSLLAVRTHEERLLGIIRLEGWG